MSKPGSDARKMAKPVFGWAIASMLFGLSAQAQEPVTTSAYVVIQTVAAVVSVIGAGISGIANSNWEKSASGKLDTIIQQNVQIISDLRGLRVFIPAALEVSFNKEVVIQGVSLSKRFDQYMAPKKPDIDQIKKMRPEIEALAYNVASRGPSVYPSAGAMALLEIAALKVIGSVDQNQKKHFQSEMLAQMKEWQGNKPGMFGALIQEETNLTNTARAALKSIRRGNVEIYSRDTSYGDGSVRDRPIRCHITMNANIVIDDEALTSAVSYTGQGGNCQLSWEARLIRDAVSGKRASIAAIIETIKIHQARLDDLKRHSDSLAKIMTEIERT